MAVNTYFLHFEADCSKFQNGHEPEAKIAKLLGKYVTDISLVYSLPMDDGGLLLLYTGHRGSFVTVRAFMEGTITINVEHFREDGEDGLISNEQYNAMLNEFATVLGSELCQKFPVVQRGPVKRYYQTEDDRVTELDIDGVVFEETSPYQSIQIVHSPELGNILIIDKKINLAACDLVYTETLMQRGKEDYQNKEILILGGGDGALLHEILKEKPKSVVMVDIDEVVIRASRLHMREANGGVLDNFKGPNHEIIIGDCLTLLSKMSKEGKKFDFVFADLTDTPYEEDRETKTSSSTLSFMKDVMNISFRVMKPSGKYMCHCCAASNRDSIRIFEKNLQFLDEPVDFTSSTAMVPSFYEYWQFYQVWRKNS